jgi:hypothetical protein
MLPVAILKGLDQIQERIPNDAVLLSENLGEAVGEHAVSPPFVRPRQT